MILPLGYAKEPVGPWEVHLLLSSCGFGALRLVAVILEPLSLVSQ